MRRKQISWRSRREAEADSLPRVNDPAISALNTVDYYNDVLKKMRGQEPEAFVRLYSAGNAALQRWTGARFLSG